MTDKCPNCGKADQWACDLTACESCGQKCCDACVVLRDGRVICDKCQRKERRDTGLAQDADGNWHKYVDGERRDE